MDRSYHSAAYAHHRAKAAAYHSKAQSHLARASVHRTQFGDPKTDYANVTSYTQIARAWAAFQKEDSESPLKRALHRRALGLEEMKRMLFAGLRARADETATGLDDAHYIGSAAVQTWGELFEEAKRSYLTQPTSFGVDKVQCLSCSAMFIPTSTDPTDYNRHYCSLRCRENALQNENKNGVPRMW
jgi:hypothetical protein